MAPLILLLISPARVDVNVHPTKREVRFLDEPLLFGELMRAVKQQTRRLVPGWNLDPKDAGTGRLWENGELPGRDPGRPAPWEGERRLPEQTVLDALYGDGSGGPAASAVRDAPAVEPEAPDQGGRAGIIEGTPATAEAGRSGHGLIALWQLHQRYLFAQTRQGCLIIDQHAAHERILYERALAQLRGSPAATQQLLFPLVIELEPAEWEAWRSVSEDLINLGIDGEEFGPQSVLLRGIPALWDQDPAGRFREFLHEAVSRHTRGWQRQERLAAAFACRSAVRSGRTLSLEEMNALVDQLFATSQPHGDPHGRPTFIQVTIADLDRRFGRSG